jgi:hypothetical protein
VVKFRGEKYLARMIFGAIIIHTIFYDNCGKISRRKICRTCGFW